MHGESAVQGRAIPGWIVSVLFHGVLLLACAVGLQSCQSTSGEDGPGDFRNVGLVFKSPPAATTDSSAVEPTTASQDTVPSPAAPADPVLAEATDDRAAIEGLLNLPETQGPQILGPGARLPGSPLADPTGLVPREALPGGQPLAGLQKGETQFLGIRDKGTRFVYVLDRSGSMSRSVGPNRPTPLEVAKSELMASLQHLDASQQFQVIFYNNQHRPMTLGGRNTLHSATDINKTLARQQIARVTGDGGTFHYPALKTALQFDPEVIYFLTDADQNTSIHPGDMERLVRTNRGRTRIHTIKFGQGAELVTNHYVRQLAVKNGGRYRYRDINSFSRRPAPR